MTDVERFAAAKRLPAYTEAMANEPPASSWTSVIVPLVALGLVFGGMSFAFVAMRMWFLIIICAAMWVYVAIDGVRGQRAPIRRALTIVGAAGSAAGGDPYAGVSAMRRFLVLRTEDRNERGYAATPMAAAGLSNGDLGVAVFRGNRVVAFYQLEA